MNFDFKAYSKLLNDLIIEGEKKSIYRDPTCRAMLAPVCRFLRISKLISVVYDSDCEPDNVKSETYTYFEEACSDPSRTVTYTEKLTNIGNTVFTFYQRLNDPDWCEEELEQIASLEKILFIMSDRNLAVTLAKDLTMMDSDLHVYPLTFFLSTVNNLIRQGRIGEYGSVYFNLRHFSSINDKFGRDRATDIMRQFVYGIQEHILSEECICRVGGDNFVVLFKKSSLSFIKDYLSGTPITYSDDEKTITVSTVAGYYMIPQDTESATDVMDRISTAYQLAKTVYKRRYLFYDDEIIQRRNRIKEIEMMFPNAISNEEFKVFYQPKTQLKNYRIAGAEALCRWFRNGKIVSPGDFIPILESSKAICTLDFYMLEHVCRDIRRWLDEGKKVVKVSVNLSRLHLGDHDLLESIIRIIDKYDVPHHYIELELTETTTDVDFKELKKIVNGLRDQGISTSVDDFGIGYSSLNLIREMPWNALKIDKSFLPTHEEEYDPFKVKMLRHIITMSQDLGLECIVEGVETAEQVKLLKDCKCYLAQGFFFDKPLPVTEFEKKLDNVAG